MTSEKVTLVSSNDESFVALESKMIKLIVEDGCARDDIPVTKVNSQILAKVIEYCEKHVEASRAGTGADEDLKAFDAEFVKVDPSTLCDLVEAAYFLHIKELLDLTSQAVVDMLIKKSPEEIRQTFNIKNDFSPEEEKEVLSENRWALPKDLAGSCVFDTTNLLFPKKGEEHLLPGFSPDAELYCIAKVPRKYLPKLKCISTKYKELLESLRFRKFREDNGLAETWIYASCWDYGEEFSCLYVFNPLQLTWKLMETEMKGRSFDCFEALGNKLYCVGGGDDFLGPPVTSEVLSLDVGTNKVKREASLCIARGGHTTQVVNGKILVLGGGESYKPDNVGLQSESYDPQTNSWTLLQDTHSFGNIFDSVQMDGKIYVKPCLKMGVYDPSTNKWEMADPNFEAGWSHMSTGVNLDGIIHVIHPPTRKLKKWNPEKRSWIEVGDLHKLPVKDLSRWELVPIKKKLYFIGDDLVTAIIDMEDPSNAENIKTYIVTEPVK